MAVLQAQSRTRTSSAEARRLRKSGIMPMALIARDQEPRLLQAPTKAVKEVLSAQEGLAKFQLALDEAKDPVNVVIKQIHRDEVTRRVTHLVLQEIKDNDTVRISIPLRFHGTPESVRKNAATLMRVMSQLELEAEAQNLPDAVEVDVSKMKSRDKITVGDLKLPEGVKALNVSAAVVASTKPTSRGAAAAADAAEADAALEEATEGAEAAAEATEEASA